MGGRGGGSGNDPDNPKPPDDPNNPKPPKPDDPDDPDDPDAPNNPSDPTTWTWDYLQDYVRREPDESTALSKARQWMDAQSGDIVTLQDDFMTAPETFRRIMVRGIELLYTLDNKTNAAKTAKELATEFNTLPDLLRAHVTRIIMTTQQAPNGAIATTGTGDNNLVFYGGEKASAATLAHEAAHCMAREKWKSSAPPRYQEGTDEYYERIEQGLPVRSDYGDAISSGEPAVSAYGATSDTEDFSEAVEMYVIDRSRLKRIAPRRYAVIHRLMTERGYGG